jgi:carboxylesterase
METTTSKDWLLHARKSLDSIAKDYNNINLVGISMGALISIILAAENTHINKIVSMSAPIVFRNKLLKLTPILKYVKRFNEIVPPEVVEGENDDLDIGYRRTPLRCAPHLIKISKMARKSLPHIKNSILIIQSEIDGQVMRKSAEIIYNNVSSSQKEIMLLDNSKHVVTIGLQRKEVEEKITEFLIND